MQPPKWVWGILFSHPSDFTPVCTTELARVANLTPEFEKRGVKVIALSCDSVDSHNKWIKARLELCCKINRWGGASPVSVQDIKSYAERAEEGFPYPIIADESRALAVQLGMLDPVERDKDGLPLTCRAVFIVGPEKTLRLSILYPATTGRNFDEILRVVDALQLTDKNKVATPADWKRGGDCMVLPNLSEKEATSLFPKGFSVTNLPSGKPYLRVTPQP
uniref:Thioredoxin domain-containing protein n=2 Tax=Timema TaxID=61471 RepID=A0A7R9FKA5_9NEOP|nr:unnamed protein product [Timema tahoe]